MELTDNQKQFISEHKKYYNIKNIIKSDSDLSDKIKFINIMSDYDKTWLNKNSYLIYNWTKKLISID